jgi:AraC family ethanolamine operon transcriptional activator
VGLSLHDADDFCAATQGFDVEFQQLDHGNLRADLSYFASADCNVQRLKLSRRFHQQGSAPGDMITFGLPDIRTLTNWRGSALESPSLLNFNRPSGYESVSEIGFSAYTFAVSERLLYKELDALGSSIGASNISASDDWHISDASIRGNLQAIGDQLVSDGSVTQGNAEKLTELQSSLAHNLARVISADETINLRANARQKDRAIGRAMELIMGSNDPVTISDLKAYSGVCWRTLDRAFMDRFGIGPKQYIMAVRLSAARRELQSAAQRQKVTDIATEWGFTHMGRFSSNYKRMFGELPSATRNRPR